MKNKKIFIIVTIIVLFIVFVFFYEKLNYEKSIKNKEYNIKSNLYSVVKVNNDYFNNQKEAKYLDYDLIFVSYYIENNTDKNYNLNLKLHTNSNVYDISSGAYLTKDNSSLVEDFLKVCGHYYERDEEVLCRQSKKCISAFMIPKNEFNDSNSFKILDSSYDTEFQPIVFNNSNIIDSNNLKELFSDDEIEEAEQRISLYYTAYHTINALYSQSSAWNSDNKQSLELYLQVVIGLLEANNPINWNSQIEEIGYKLNYDKSIELFPNLKSDIETLKDSIEIQRKADNALKQYNNISSINYSEYTNNSYNLMNACNNIKNTFLMY